MLKSIQVLGFCGALVGSHIAAAATCDPAKVVINELGVAVCIEDSGLNNILSSLGFSFGVGGSVGGGAGTGGLGLGGDLAASIAAGSGGLSFGIRP